MKFPWRGTLGLALSVALLWLAFRGVHWSDVVENLRRANLWLVLLSVAIATMIFPLRAIRWGPILEPVIPVPFPPRWRATAVGMMANNILPARIGELVRAYVLSRET